MLPPPLLLSVSQRTIPPILCWLLYPPLTFFCSLITRKNLHIQINYPGGPNIVYCEQCMLLSCLTSQYNICSFVVLRCPPYLMVPVAVSTFWYDNYGLAIRSATTARFNVIPTFCRTTYLRDFSLNNRNYLCHYGSDIIDSTGTYCSIYQ